jgi:hypothetical protein
MGGKEPSVIYECGQPITMDVINKSIFYIEGSYDNGQGGPSLQQQQELIAITTLDQGKKKSPITSNTSANIANQRRKPKYIAISTDDNDDISSQVLLKSMQQKQQQQQQQQQPHTPQKSTTDYSEFMRQLEREKTVFIELMEEYDRIIKGIDFNVFLHEITEFRDQELIVAREILESHLDGIPIYNPDDALRRIVDIIDTERKSLLDYAMNIIHRRTQCTEYFNRYYKKFDDDKKKNNDIEPVNESGDNNRVVMRPITSMYVTFQK